MFPRFKTSGLQTKPINYIPRDITVLITPLVPIVQKRTWDNSEMHLKKAGFLPKTSTFCVILNCRSEIYYRRMI